MYISAVERGDLKGLRNLLLDLINVDVLSGRNKHMKTFHKTLKKDVGNRLLEIMIYLKQFISSYNYPLNDLKNLIRKLRLNPDLSHILHGLNSLWSEQYGDILHIFKSWKSQCTQQDMSIISNILSLVNGNSSLNFALEICPKMIKQMNYSQLAQICPFDRDANKMTIGGDFNSQQMFWSVQDVLEATSGNVLK